MTSEDLVGAFRAGRTRPDLLAGPAIEHLRAHWPATLDALARNALLAELLVSVPVYPAWLEGRLVALRRMFLLEGCAEPQAPLLAALAIQCHLNEYAWAADPVERAWVEGLAARVGDLSPFEVMILGCYRPLAALPGVDGLLAKGWSGPPQAVLHEQVALVREEQALARLLPAITPIRHEVSQAVKAQYEANPYPRWAVVTATSQVTQIWGVSLPEAPEVLFAGCGTGQHAIQAGQRYAGARVLAVDLSRASLAYALRKTREAGITNMTYAQADLLELGSVDRTFDVIECSGVLHHLADPFEGARVLAGLLRPGGLMKLGLYSALARRGLAAAKALARGFTPDTIPDLRAAIMAAPDGDPVRWPMRFTDFYAASACRDLLMHVQEHEHSVADLQRMTEENGLELLGFAVGPDVQAAYRAKFPGSPPGGSFVDWAAFEARYPATFAGMYQFWVRKRP